MSGHHAKSIRVVAPQQPLRARANPHASTVRTTPSTRRIDLDTHGAASTGRYPVDKKALRSYLRYHEHAYVCTCTHCTRTALPGLRGIRVCVPKALTHARTHLHTPTHRQTHAETDRQTDRQADTRTHARTHPWHDAGTNPRTD